MTNKPKFNLFKNITYALQGMQEVCKSETSFKIELAIITLVVIGLIFANITTTAKLILFVSMWLVPFAEAINSAIERVVDLITLEHHELAKQAKDISSFVVLLAFIIVGMIWGITLYIELDFIP